MKRSLILLIILVAQPLVRADEVTLNGEWVGHWIRDGSSLAVTLRFERTDRMWEGTFDSPQLRVIGIPLREISADLPHVAWKVVGDRTTMSFRGTLEGDVLSGEFRENGAGGTFRFQRSSSATTRPREKEIAFRNGDVVLSGTLLLPAAPSTTVPAVVFLHGSGAEGRWASKYLATTFANAGIAALIYDKRGVGKSTGDWTSAGFEELADDSAAAIRALKQEHGVDPRRIGIHGHSQSGTYSPLVAQRVPDLAFVIASAAAGLPLDQVEIYSLENSVNLAALEPTEAKKARRFIDALVGTAYRGESRDRLLNLWKEVRGEPWVFELPGENSHYWSFSRRIASFNPQQHWSKVRSPVLLIFGELDQRVPARASAARITSAILEAGGTSVSVRILPGADHTFRLASGKSPWPSSAPRYPDLLVEWVLSVTGGDELRSKK